MGTAHAIAPASVGNRVMVLDDLPLNEAVPSGWPGETIALRTYAGPADAMGEPLEVEIGLGPVLPLAPVHLNAERGAGTNDITFSWTRCGRADTDSWVPEDAPLDLSPEAYRVAIYSGVTLKRTIDVTSPAASYSAAQQTTDFGAPPSSFTFKIAQKSPVYGPGHWAQGTFHA